MTSFFSHLRILMYLLLCALILNLPAIDNGFVFLFQDSADYLSGRIHIFRLPIYSTFAKIGYKFYSIWVIAFAQALIISHLIYLINKSIYGRINYIFMLLQIGILTTFSSLPYFAAFMMADVFTSILFMALYLLIFHDKSLDKITIYYLYVLIAFSAMAHITNIYLGVGLIIFAGLVHFTRSTHYKNLRANLIAPCLLLLFSSSFIIGLNYHYFKALSLSPSSSVFTLANLVEQGSARNYLIKACPKANYKICAYIGDLPKNVDNFLWGQNSLTSKLGSFTGLRSEAKYIVKNTITTYPKDVALNTFSYIIRSFSVHTPAKEINSSVTKSSVTYIIKVIYGQAALDKFMASKQANDELPYQRLEKIDNWVFPISLILTILLCFQSLIKIGDNRFTLPLFALVFVIGNNILCSSASGLFDRYQARVSWLLVFAFIIMLGSTFIEKQKSENTNI